MNIEPIIFFEMAATIAILAFSLVGMVFYLSHALKRHTSPQDFDETLKKNRGLLDETREKAVKILDEANSKALDIVNKATLSTDIASESFSKEIKNIASLQIKEFEKATSDFMKLYTQVLQDLKSKNIEVFQNVSKDIEVNTIEEIKSFKESMEKLTSSSERLVQKKIDIDYVTVKKEIEDYKETTLKKIDQEIYGLLEKVAKEVLGKALSLSEHEILIEKSLEKAKKEGVFK